MSSNKTLNQSKQTERSELSISTFLPMPTHVEDPVPLLSGDDELPAALGLPLITSPYNRTAHHNVPLSSFIRQAPIIHPPVRRHNNLPRFVVISATRWPELSAHTLVTFGGQRTCIVPLSQICQQGSYYPKERSRASELVSE